MSEPFRLSAHLQPAPTIILAMTRLVLALVGWAMATMACAMDDALVSRSASGDYRIALSNFSADLTAGSYDLNTSVLTFSGKVSVRGTVHFQFDRAQDGDPGEVIFATLVLDKASRKKLPQVVAGYRPRSNERVSLQSPRAALSMLFGPLRAKDLETLGPKILVVPRVAVTLNNYLTEVSCDARHYWANAIAIHAPSAVPRSQAATNMVVGAC